MNRWYILLTHSQQEGIAHAGLIGRGFRAYAPTFCKNVCFRKATATSKGSQHKVARPLFPGYGFIELVKGEEPWERVRGVPGVRNFLNIEGRPASLPAEAVMAIRAKEELEEQKFASAKAGKRYFPYKAGDKVVILKEPFAELLGEVEKLDDKGRITILLELFGRASSVTMDASEIKAA